MRGDFHAPYPPIENPAPPQAVNFTDFSVGSLGRTYRYHTPASPGGAPLWDFGYGLSYTTWALSWPGGAPPAPLVLSGAAFSATVNVTVTNTGAVDGDEVVQARRLLLLEDGGRGASPSHLLRCLLSAQAYFTPGAIAAPAPPFLPLRQLLFFQRVHVRAGAAVTVSVPVTPAGLLMTSASGVRQAYPGTYTLTFTRGPGSADDLGLAATVEA